MENTQNIILLVLLFFVIIGCFYYLNKISKKPVVPPIPVPPIPVPNCNPECENNSKCILDKDGNSICECDQYSGWYGKSCEKCKDNWDKNSGCVRCKSSYTGPNCDIPVPNPPTPVPPTPEPVCGLECKNNGKCILDKDGNSSCVCIANSGWYGKTCEECKNGWNISKGCTVCLPEFTGPNCDVPVVPKVECQDPACSGNGKCDTSVGKCICENGYTGITCSESSGDRSISLVSYNPSPIVFNVNTENTINVRLDFHDYVYINNKTKLSASFLILGIPHSIINNIFVCSNMCKGMQNVSITFPKMVGLRPSSNYGIRLVIVEDGVEVFKNDIIGVSAK